MESCCILQAFSGIAKVLGSAVSERADLRMEVMASLRKLINQSLQSGNTVQNF